MEELPTLSIPLKKEANPALIHIKASIPYIKHRIKIKKFICLSLSLTQCTNFGGYISRGIL